MRPNAWRFRDWVIDAINRDQPFDHFTIEQLAGDLLPNPTLEQLTATGFHRNAARNTEAGVDKEEARFQYIADRVNTTGRVWLGLTIGCAQCHTHKYDPITIRDYYGFYAFFNNTEDRDEPTNKAQTLAESMKDRRETYVHLAGSYTRCGPTVVPASLSALPPLSVQGEATRLDLARWLVSPTNPLTSRVAVNHVWSKLFGTGIVSTPDDFGATGDPPSHPELLDWLATEFMRSGWSRKRLIRLIVTSATYRQSSSHRADLVEVEPLNRLLAGIVAFALLGLCGKARASFCACRQRSRRLHRSRPLAFIDDDDALAPREGPQLGGTCRKSPLRPVKFPASLALIRHGLAMGRPGLAKGTVGSVLVPVSSGRHSEGFWRPTAGLAKGRVGISRRKRRSCSGRTFAATTLAETKFLRLSRFPQPRGFVRFARRGQALRERNHRFPDRIQRFRNRTRPLRERASAQHCGKLLQNS